MLEYALSEKQYLLSIVLIDLPGSIDDFTIDQIGSVGGAGRTLPQTMPNAVRLQPAQLAERGGELIAKLDRAILGPQSPAREGFDAALFKP